MCVPVCALACAPVCACEVACVRACVHAHQCHVTGSIVSALQHADPRGQRGPGFESWFLPTTQGPQGENGMEETCLPEGLGRMNVIQEPARWRGCAQ